jgi:cell division protein FtsI (penicillin-binding protein 3)
MMRPYLVNEVRKDGIPVKSFPPVAVNEQICNPQVLQQLRMCLEGVVLRGTAHSLKTPAYQIAGKTGTSLVADKGIRYSDHMYQSSFAGYFPADNPQFTIVVVIRNKPHAAKYYGGAVAGPVFREVADRLYAGYLYKQWAATGKSDSSLINAAGLASTLKKVSMEVALNVLDSTEGHELGELVTTEDFKKVMRTVDASARQMPALAGFGLKDALEVCEERGLMVTISGKGKVRGQSIEPGSSVRKGQTIHLELN